MSYTSANRQTTVVQHLFGFTDGSKRTATTVVQCVLHCECCVQTSKHYGRHHRRGKAPANPQQLANSVVGVQAAGAHVRKAAFYLLESDSPPRHWWKEEP